MLRAETLVCGRCLGYFFFFGCACKVLFNTNYSKIRLWVSQSEDSEFANVPHCCALSLFLPHVKWENAPLTQRVSWEEISVLIMGPYKHAGDQSKA